MQNISFRGSGMRRKGDSSLDFFFSLSLLPSSLAFLASMGRIGWIRFTESFSSFSNISGYNTVYYSSFILGYIEEILVEFEEGVGRLLAIFFRLRATNSYVKLKSVYMLTVMESNVCSISEYQEGHQEIPAHVWDQGSNEPVSSIQGEPIDALKLK